MFLNVNDPGFWIGMAVAFLVLVLIGRLFWVRGTPTAYRSPLTGIVMVLVVLLSLAWIADFGFDRARAWIGNRVDTAVESIQPEDQPVDESKSSTATTSMAKSNENQAADAAPEVASGAPPEVITGTGPCQAAVGVYPQGNTDPAGNLIGVPQTVQEASALFGLAQECLSPIRDSSQLAIGWKLGDPPYTVEFTAYVPQGACVDYRTSQELGRWFEGPATSSTIVDWSRSLAESAGQFVGSEATIYTNSVCDLSIFDFQQPSSVQSVVKPVQSVPAAVAPTSAPTKVAVPPTAVPPTAISPTAVPPTAVPVAACNGPTVPGDWTQFVANGWKATSATLTGLTVPIGVRVDYDGGGFHAEAAAGYVFPTYVGAATWWCLEQ